MLEFYSCKSEEATLSKAVYIPYPSIDSDGGVDISGKCYDAVVYMCAGLAAMTCGEGERANGLIQTANEKLKTEK